MATGKHLNRATIGPNTDHRAAMVALATDILDREVKALGDAEHEAGNWSAFQAIGKAKTASVRAARRAVDKARLRVDAASKLYDIAVANAERRVYIFTDAPQTPPVGQQASETPEMTTESSDQNQAVSREDSGSENQATVSPGNCACMRYAATPEMGDRTTYDHHPRCQLPMPTIDPDARPFWPLWVGGVALVPTTVDGLQGSGL